MSLTRKASSAAKKPTQAPRQDLAVALAEREAELAEARRQQAATAEILHVISRSKTDAAPVFETILEACRRLFASDEMGVYTIGDDEMVRVAAWLGPRAEEVRRDVTPLADSVTGRIIRDRRIHHIPDLRDEPNLSETVRERVERLGSASLLYAPMLWEDRGLGSIVVARSPPRPFSDREQEVLQTFADQAAIAIENARLFKETQESLRRQTATGDILRAIASSPGDLQPVLDRLAETSCRLCEAYDALIFLRDGDDLRLASHYGLIPFPFDFSKGKIARDWPAGRAMVERRTIHVHDLAAAGDEYPLAFQFAKDAARARGIAWRSVLSVPLLREGEPVGVIALRRTEVWPFTEAQIALLQTFADQAVIAIENTRLFDAVQARTRDLEESLEQQTAAAEILRVISHSPTDVQPVFDAIAQSVTALCEADNSGVFQVKDGLIHYVGHANLPPKQLALALQSFPAPLNRGTASGRAILSRGVVHIPDIAADPEYSAASVIEAGFRSALSVPMLRNGEPIGAINVTRLEARPFSGRQIELLKTFADQAVIAVSNVGLFNETQEALERQTATADILKVIASSPTNVQPVFEAIATRANSLLGGFSTAVFRIYGDALHLEAFTSTGAGGDEALKALFPLPLARFPAIEPILAGHASQIADTELDGAIRDLARMRGFRSMLITPLTSKGAPIGAISVTRRETGAFPGNHVQLLQTFADQAVIAISNVGLFNETQEALRRQTATSDILTVIASSPSNLQPVLDKIVETACRLCGAYDAVVLLREGDRLRPAAHHGPIPITFDSKEISRGWAGGRAVIEGRTIHIDDFAKQADEYPVAPALASAVGSGEMLWRATVVMPLMREGEAIGAIGLRRAEPVAFSEAQIELLKTFSDQAMIAIENVRLFDAVQARTREVEEALAQQTATADVLKVISRSAFDLQVVFDTLVTSAVKLCGAGNGVIYLKSGDAFTVKAVSIESEEAEVVRLLRERPPKPGRGSVGSRILLTGEVQNVSDIQGDPDYDSALRAVQFNRSMLGVPLKRDSEVVGGIVLARAQPGPYSQRQIELVQTFADQAVIAIENVRLFDEVQARTKDLQEALQQQTATANVLKVISRSAFDLDAVLKTLTDSARSLSGAATAAVFLRDGDLFPVRAESGVAPEFLEYLNAHPARPAKATLIGRVAMTGEAVLIPDALADPDYDYGVGPDIGNYRALFGAPLIRDGKVEGVFGLMHPKPSAFMPRQMEMVRTFADQAVIAIENARLFDEVQARTREVEEALAQQTATSEVLKVISRSAFDLQPVLDTLVESAARLCDTEMAFILRRDGDVFRAGAAVGHSAEYMDYLLSHPISVDRGSVTGRVALERRVVQILDVRADPEYTLAQTTSLTGQRTALGVPLIRDGDVIGVIVLGRRRVEAFTARQIELVESFADQAVIAISNVGLFNETQESLAQQTATADVLKVISRSAFDLQTVLDTLAASAAGLIGANFAVMYLKRGDSIRPDATFGCPPELIEFLVNNPQRPGRETVAGRVFLHAEVQTIPDVLADQEYVYGDAPRLGNFRALLGVPMFRDGEVEGSFTLGRAQPGPFTQRQVELVQTFADQAVIAIENARLFNEVQAKTRDLEESLAQQTATADVLKVISRSAFDLDVVFEALLTSAVSLVGSRTGTICVREGDGFRYRAVAEGRDSAMWRYLSEHPPTPGRSSVAGRVLLSGKPEIISDTLLDSDFQVPVHTLAGSRSVAGVPLLRDNRVEGALMVGRAEAGPFDPRQIEVLQTFADQAVIAIENVRLFDEVQARTRDLTEALQQQTATADVLKVISRSAFDLQAVFETLLKSAVELVGAIGGAISVREGDQIRFRTSVSVDHGLPRQVTGRLAALDRSTAAGRAILSGRLEYVPDIDKDPDYVRVTASAPARSALAVPLSRDGRAEGALTLVAGTPDAFTPRHFELVQTFADQAVIAIENVRLFDEVQARTRDLQEALQQQTATSDVLKVISRSAFDLDAVLKTLTDSARALSGAATAVVFLRDGDVMHLRAESGCAPEFVAYMQIHPTRPGMETLDGRVMLTGETVHIPDVGVDPAYNYGPGPKIGDYRAGIGVPLMRGGQVDGVFSLMRPEPGAFTARQIEMVRAFADQAVIAIENARLFDEVQARTRDLEEALAQQTATADVLKVISRSMLDLDSVLQTLIDTAVRLARGSRGTIFLQKGDALVASAFHSNVPDGLREYLANASWRLDGDTPPAQAAREGQVVHIADLSKLEDESTREVRKRAPYGAGLWVPLIGESQTIGVFGVPRDEPIAFTDREIEIVKTFADQAVIAIENARLFGEVQARTKELAASLDDLRKAQDRLIQSEKLASLGQLTAGIAHEIKNPLNFVNNFSALSQELVGELADVINAAPLGDSLRDEAEELIGTIAGNLDKVVSHGKRADSIVKNMLLHSREGSGERSETNINAMVEEALNLAYHGARAEKPGFNVTIVKSLDPGAGNAEVYAQEMTRVLLNLISNGFYATMKRKQAEPDGAYEPTLTATTRDLGKSVEIAIRDNGTGIPDAVKEKMFNPFFTTKPAGEGTGLGLSLSHDIVVKQHGGTLEVSTEPRAYSEFRITLPRSGGGK